MTTSNIVGRSADRFPALATLTLCVMIAVPGLVRAETAACSQFNWPLDVELGWFRDKLIESQASGATLARVPDQGISLALDEVANIAFPQPFSKPDKANSGFGGFIAFEAAPAGHDVQVSLSSGSWVDVIQNGQPVAATAFTNDRSCQVIHKSLRFTLAPGPFLIQVAGAPEKSILIAIRAVP